MHPSTSKRGPLSVEVCAVWAMDFSLPFSKLRGFDIWNDSNGRYSLPWFSKTFKHSWPNTKLRQNDVSERYHFVRYYYICLIYDLFVLHSYLITATFMVLTMYCSYPPAILQRCALAGGEASTNTNHTWGVADNGTPQGQNTIPLHVVSLKETSQLVWVLIILISGDGFVTINLSCTHVHMYLETQVSAIVFLSHEDTSGAKDHCTRQQSINLGSTGTVEQILTTAKVARFGETSCLLLWKHDVHILSLWQTTGHHDSLRPPVVIEMSEL